MATVLLLRHGETDWNRDRLAQGWAPVALNERGREQAGAAGTHLAATYEIDSVVASDLQRTRETATLIGESGVRAEPTFDRDWRERGFGVLQGLGYESVFGDHPEYDVASGNADALKARPENGESLLDVRDRVLRGWDSVLGRVRVDRSTGSNALDDRSDSEDDRTATGDDDGGDGHEAESDETVLVVTHGGPIYVLLAHIEGISIPEMFGREHQANCAINEIGVDAANSDTDADAAPDVEIVRRNDTSYRE